MDAVILSRNLAISVADELSRPAAAYTGLSVISGSVITYRMWVSSAPRSALKRHMARDELIVMQPVRNCGLADPGGER